MKFTVSDHGNEDLNLPPPPLLNSVEPLTADEMTQQTRQTEPPAHPLARQQLSSAWMRRQPSSQPIGKRVTERPITSPPRFVRPMGMFPSHAPSPIKDELTAHFCLFPSTVSGLFKTCQRSSAEAAEFHQVRPSKHFEIFS